MKNSTLCYIEREDAYLMMHRIKKEQDENRDKWIGIGGKFEEGESPEECLLREVQEETGLHLIHYRYCGIITFVSDQWQTEYMHLFHSTEFCGELHDCEEGQLAWVQKQDLHSLALWEGDLLFLDLLEAKIPFFSLKLEYQQNHLIRAVLNGKQII